MVWFGHPLNTWKGPPEEVVKKLADASDTINKPNHNYNLE